MMNFLVRGPASGALMLASLGCGAGPAPESPNEFEAGRPGQRAYVDVSGQPRVAPAAAESDRQTGQVAVLGNVDEAAHTRDGIVADALASKDAHRHELPLALSEQLAANASRAAKDLVPTGKPLSADLSQGEHAVGRWTLRPRACYVIVSAATEQVTTMQINLIAGPPRPPKLLAQSESGATPSLGMEQCLSSRSSSPLQILVDIHVIRGHGTAALQFYKR